MAQMYKVFANEKCIYFISKNNFSVEKMKGSLLIFPTSQKEFKRKIKQFSESKTIDSLHVNFENKKKMNDFVSSFFKIIEAAGGLVKNNSGNLLMIYRNGKWDLPKGKVEKNEKIKQAASREVKEECGMIDLKMGKKLETTLHFYMLKNKFILKKTHWFEMQSNEKKLLKPQLEEGITKVKWMNKLDVKKAMKNTYPLIENLIKNNF